MEFKPEGQKIGVYDEHRLVGRILRFGPHIGFEPSVWVLAQEEMEEITEYIRGLKDKTRVS